MSVVQISDVVVPEEFTQYIVENSMVSTAVRRQLPAIFAL